MSRQLTVHSPGKEMRRAGTAGGLSPPEHEATPRNPIHNNNQEPTVENLEIFELTDADNEPGFYYWFCAPNCLPDCDPIGPFDTGEQAYEHAVATFALELGDEDDDNLPAQ